MADTKDNRIEILRKIDVKYQQIENKYSAYQIELCPEYRQELNHKLFSQLQYQLTRNGLRNIQELRNEQSHQSLSDIIANLPPEKMSKLLEILIDEDSQQTLPTRLSQIYQIDEPGYDSFQAFLQAHQISFLGGSNSKNFKITPFYGAPYVLKVENRLGVPAEVEQHLRQHSLANTLGEVSISRQSCYEKIPGIKYCSRNLVVTEFFHGGDIEHYQKSMSNSSIASALNIYHQMASILQGIQNDGCVFPDMKNSNWLVSADGHLKIADSKSFLFADGEVLNLQKLEPRGYFLTDTRHLRPPEVWQALKGSPCSTDKMHAFMLGKNLYQYLTACDETYLLDKDNAQMLDFSNPKFNTPLGKELQSLIQGLVIADPLQRLTMHQALDKLTELQLANECQTLLEKISAFKHTPGSAEFVQAYSQSRDLGVLSHYYQKHVVRENCYQMQEDLNIENEIQDQLQSKSSEELDAIQQQLFEKCKPYYTQLCQQLLQHINQLDNRPSMAAQRLKLQEKLDSLASFDDYSVLKKQLESYQQQVALLPVCQFLSAEISKYDFVSEFEKKLNSNQTNFSHLRNDMLVYLTRCECQDILKQIQQKRFGDNDTAMDEFINKYAQEITSAKSYQELIALKSNLSETLTRLNHPILVEIKAIVDDYRLRDKSIFSFGVGEKADNIEREMAKLSIEARCKFYDSQDLETDLKAVFEQIASRRLLVESGSFKKLKEKLKDLKQQAASPEENQSDKSFGKKM